jgi:cell division protein FtsB
MPPRAREGLEDNALPEDDIDKLRRQNDLLQRRIEQLEMDWQVERSQQLVARVQQLERENSELRDAQRETSDV